MAILQWYTVMPGMLSDFHGYFFERKETDLSISLSTISFLFSFLSLAWGFTSYSAAQKDGALDLSWSPVGRLLLFVSDLFLIFSRINSLVLFMYFWGPGEFKPGMLLILGHVLVMMLVHYYTMQYKIEEDSTDEPDYGESGEETRKDCTYYMKLIYICLLNGLANIFINNFINVSFNRYKHIGTKKKKTFHRQLCGDLLFLAQNVVMVCLGLSVNVKPLNNPTTATYLGCAILSCHLIGLFVKVIYYKHFHIWKDLAPRVTTHGLKRGLAKSHIQWSKDI
jgi:hypothetical protein